MLLAAMTASAQSSFEAQRAELIEEIERDVRETRSYTGRARLDDSVMKAMATVARHEFVPSQLRDMAYENRPLPIGEGQTISQPYIVALMTEALRLQPADRVLEVGAGSGYQAAVLAELVPEGRVVTVELVRGLADRARDTLEDLEYKNVIVEDATDELGCPWRGPYDAIVVSAAAPSLAPLASFQRGDGARAPMLGSTHFATTPTAAATPTSAARIDVVRDPQGILGELAAGGVLDFDLVAALEIENEQNRLGLIGRRVVEPQPVDHPLAVVGDLLAADAAPARVVVDGEGARLGRLGGL
jgi:protein-L-isoaspartate(D-aspartate) O-methyltransferase